MSEKLKLNFEKEIILKQFLIEGMVRVAINEMKKNNYIEEKQST
jgi:hypothetical protein